MADNPNEIVLKLDKDDMRAVQAAIARRQQFRYDGVCVMPTESRSNKAGALIAEICRGWMEMLDKDRPKE